LWNPASTSAYSTLPLRFVAAWSQERGDLERELGRALRVEVEPGRYLVAECGVLLTEVRGTKRATSKRGSPSR